MLRTGVSISNSIYMDYITDTWNLRVPNQYLYIVPHEQIQYIPRNMHRVFALLCFVVVIHWLIFPYPSGLLHWHCGNLTIAPVPAKQPWWIWINTSCEFIMNDCITTTKKSTTKPCAYFSGYTVKSGPKISVTAMSPGIARQSAAAILKTKWISYSSPLQGYNYPNIAKWLKKTTLARLSDTYVSPHMFPKFIHPRPS